MLRCGSRSWVRWKVPPLEEGGGGGGFPDVHPVHLLSS